MPQSRASNEYTIDWSAPLMEQALAMPHKTILDYGCGFGLRCERFATAGKIAVGADEGFVPEAIENARAKGYSLAVLDDQYHLRSEDVRIFDAIWCHHVLEHCRSPIDTLEYLLTLVPVGGRLFISVPHYRQTVLPGHIVNGWDIGQLMYSLATAGWDCSEGYFMDDHATASVMAIVKKSPTVEIANLPAHDRQGGFADVKHLFHPDIVAAIEKRPAFMLDGGMFHWPTETISPTFA